MMMRRRIDLALAAAFCVGLLAACGDEDPTGPATGTLEVTAATTGNDTDSDGYTLTLDDGTEETVEADGSVTFAELDAGSYSLEVAGVAENCTLEGENPRTVEVVAGETTDIAMAVACEALQGALEVAATTTGDDVDPDGYAVLVDGTEVDSIGATDTLTFQALRAGEREVGLAGVASNCAVSGDNPRTVAVAAEGTATAAFEASCEVREGAMTVATETTGDDIDADGYALLLDGVEIDSIGVTDTLTLDGRAEGEYEIELVGTAANCEVSGDNPRSAGVAYDSTTEVTVGIVCAYNRLVYQTDQDGAENVYVVNSDGSGAYPLTLADTADDENPAWSPDGSRVLFQSDRDGDSDIYAVDEDGYGLENVTDDDHFNSYPDWSPDGERFVFRSGRSGSTQLHIADADGTNVTQVTSHATDFPIESAWSPDGSRIAFARFDGSTSDIYTIAPDGSDLQQVTNDPANAADPSWSPEGSRIVFESDRNFGDDVYVINADGSKEERLTFDQTNSFAPSWRHDGRIAFASERSDVGIGLFIMDADGNNVEAMYESPDQDIHPDWSP